MKKNSKENSAKFFAIAFGILFILWIVALVQAHINKIDFWTVIRTIIVVCVLFTAFEIIYSKRKKRKQWQKGIRNLRTRNAKRSIKP